MENLGQCTPEIREKLMSVQNSCGSLFNTSSNQIKESRNWCIQELEKIREKYFDVIDLPADVRRLTIDELDNFDADIVLVGPLFLRLSTFNAINFESGTKLHIKGERGSIDITLENVDGMRISLSSTELPMTGILIQNTETHGE
ncbi:MAG: hypothetical protein KBC47_02180 [Candidatus Peribacteraceae bacterium]|nr:hypothetical protein [Candidatus Peribacteraceae bacterium]